ncbi:MAG: rRNA pseudouridine synthase [Candidatus Liptonbacteria bacterium]|nr:rRNA pseudouridine synthase [Candidatus Liptonbacteria bacterium]
MFRKRTQPAKAPAQGPVEPRFPMRINKYLAWKNYGTRREGDSLVQEGRVLLNGRRAELGDKVYEKDNVEVRFHPKKYRYVAWNKPRSTFSSSMEEEGDEQSPIPGLFPVGQLDKYSRGLVILTDDGRITARLLNTSYAAEKEYVVTTKETISPSFKKRMEQGVNIEGYMTQPCRVELLEGNRFSIVLTEDKKHQLRRMCAALDHTTDTIERRRIANIELSGIPSGEHRAIEGTELETFLKALGM